MPRQVSCLNPRCKTSSCGQGTGGFVAFPLDKGNKLLNTDGTPLPAAWPMNRAVLSSPLTEVSFI